MGKKNNSEWQLLKPKIKVLYVNIAIKNTKNPMWIKRKNTLKCALNVLKEWKEPWVSTLLENVSRTSLLNWLLNLIDSRLWFHFLFMKWGKFQSHHSKSYLRKWHFTINGWAPTMERVFEKVRPSYHPPLKYFLTFIYLDLQYREMEAT